jgi:hypothetical protein
MLTIHITEADPAAGATAPPESQDGLAVCLAQHHVTDVYTLPCPTLSTAGCQRDLDGSRVLLRSSGHEEEGCGGCTGNGVLSRPC